MEYDSSDALGAGSYPTPNEIGEKNVTGTITITYTIDYSVPINWSDEDIKNDILENLPDYIYINDYAELEVDI